MKKETERKIEGEINIVLLTLMQLHCQTFQNSDFVPELVSSADIIRKLTSSNCLFLKNRIISTFHPHPHPSFEGREYVLKTRGEGVCVEDMLREYVLKTNCGNIC